MSDHSRRCTSRSRNTRGPAVRCSPQESDRSSRCSCRSSWYRRRRAQGNAPRRRNETHRTSRSPSRSGFACCKRSERTTGREGRRSRQTQRLEASYASQGCVPTEVRWHHSSSSVSPLEGRPPPLRRPSSSRGRDADKVGRTKAALGGVGGPLLADSGSSPGVLRRPASGVASSRRWMPAQRNAEPRSTQTSWMMPSLLGRSVSAPRRRTLATPRMTAAHTAGTNQQAVQPPVIPKLRETRKTTTAPRNFLSGGNREGRPRGAGGHREPSSVTGNRP